MGKISRCCCCCCCLGEGRGGEARPGHPTPRDVSPSSGFRFVHDHHLPARPDPRPVAADVAPTARKKYSRYFPHRSLPSLPPPLPSPLLAAFPRRLLLCSAAIKCLPTPTPPPSQPPPEPEAATAAEERRAPARRRLRRPRRRTGGRWCGGTRSCRAARCGCSSSSTTTLRARSSPRCSASAATAVSHSPPPPPPPPLLPASSPALQSLIPTGNSPLS